MLEAVDTCCTRPEVSSNTCPGPDHWPYWVSSDEPRLGKKCPRYRSWVCPSPECGEDLVQPGRTGELDGPCGSWSEVLAMLTSGVLFQLFIQ